jgi:hypothetical protein
LVNRVVIMVSYEHNNHSIHQGDVSLFPTHHNNHSIHQGDESLFLTHHNNHYSPRRCLGE